MPGLLVDLSYTIRSLRRQPGFALTAIATIALGVGLNTALFTILKATFLSGVPAPASQELVDVSQSVIGLSGRFDKGRPVSKFSTEEFRAYQDESTTLSGLTSYSRVYSVAMGGDNARDIAGRLVACSFFDVLRQPPAHGRSFVAADCARDAVPVLVLEYEFWVTEFGANADIVGERVRLNRDSFIVVGVAAPDAFEPDLQKIDFYAPVSVAPMLRPDQDSFTNPETAWLDLVGRRSDSSSIEQVRSELDVIAARIDQRHGNRTTTLTVVPATMISGAQGRGALMGAVTVGLTPSLLILFVVCANLACLTLVRATSRSFEIAVRTSLGASRSRVIQQLLTETIVIALTGGLIGVLLAFSSVDALVSLFSSSSRGIAWPADLDPDLGVLAFALALSVMTGILSGLAPALTASRPDLYVTINQDRTGDEPRRGGGLRATLVGIQVAICMVLVICAGLFVRGLYLTHTQDVGFDYGQLALATVDFRSFGYSDADAESFQRRLVAEVQALPGVESVAEVWREPLSDRGGVVLVRSDTANESPPRLAARNWVSPDYFSVIGTPLVRGRTFSADELNGDSRVAIVTEETARRLWPGQDPVGRFILSGAADNEAPLIVVGVVRDARLRAIGEVDRYFVYLPMNDTIRLQSSTIVRSTRSTTEISVDVRRIVGAIDPELAVRVRPLEANLIHWQDLSEFAAALASSVGVFALVLASMGIFGVVSYAVACRTREIGIRIALGGRSSDVLRVILGRTMWPVVIGAAIGIAVAAAAMLLLPSVRAELGVGVRDPTGVGAAVSFVLLIALAAGLWPAWRGARLDPIETLRYE